MALAQPSDVQLSLFPDFVCKADELVLDFEDGLYEIVGHEGEFTDEQRAAIQSLDDLISSMSGKQHASFWTDEALRTHPIWDQIRERAKVTLTVMGWELRRPPPSGAIYIPGA